MLIILKQLQKNICLQCIGNKIQMMQETFFAAFILFYFIADVWTALYYNNNITSGYATMVHGRGCNPHRSTTTFTNVEITSLMTS